MNTATSEASVARLEVIDQHILRIVNYAHYARVLSAAISRSWPTLMPL
jgi:hypothetical protein